MPASNGSNTSSILNGLGIAAAPDTGALPANPGGSPRPNPKLPGNDVVKTAPNNQVKPAGPISRPAMLLSAIGAGQIPGVVIPKGLTGSKTDGISQETISSSGISIYRPTDKDFMAVLFNPKKTPLQTVQAIDKAGKLASAFPPITHFLDEKGIGPGTKAKRTGGGAPGAYGKPSDVEDTGSTAGQSTPAIGVMNLTGSSPAVQPTVPILPKPGVGAGANQQLALARAKAIKGGPPSSRANPTAGSIVNGLWSAPV